MAAAETSNALDSALDELYGVDPSEFVAVRKRLAGELRALGEKESAKTLLAARRPTTAAWAMNQLSRRDPALVETFLQAGRDLQTAHGKGGPDAREAIRDATRAHRDALAAATDGAMATLESRATDGFRTQILATLHAASVDESVAERLEKGRLFREVTGSTGFPEFPGLTLVPDLEPDAALPASESEPVPKSKRMPPKRSSPASSDKESAAAAKARRAEEQKREREEAAAAELAERRTEAEAAWQDAQDEATDAESAAQEAQERVDQLEQDLDQARRDAKAADEQATSARREAARLARAVMKLQK